MPEKPIRSMPWEPTACNPSPLFSREWLVTNGLGGYASGTVSGVLTRRYHGLLVAALPAPLGRTVILSQLQEMLPDLDGCLVELAGVESSDRGMCAAGMGYLREFRLELGLPVWEYQIGSWRLEKRVLMPRHQNSVHVSYRLLQAEGPLHLELRPAVQFRALEAAVDTALVEYAMTAVASGCEVAAAGFPQLQMRLAGGTSTFVTDRQQRADILFRLEQERGYAAIGAQSSPGVFKVDLAPGDVMTFVASMEHAESAVQPDPARAAAAETERRNALLQRAGLSGETGLAAELVLAADQFIVTPGGRAEEAAQAHARGDVTTTIIAGYHWFTDWGRDTMISLEGLTLATGRHDEARNILHTFMAYVREGLIPNMFPEHDKTGLYHTADATLWFFHALHRYLQATGDRDTLRSFLPKLIGIVEHHLRGTRFNIGVDPDDGLLRQGEAGYQLTWMDAKVGDWVVTPRRGKAVELNALWYNALCLLAGWVDDEQGAPAGDWLRDHAQRTRQSFNRRFWYAEGEYLFDVIDGEQGNDTACRPNQILSVSLDHPVLDASRWQAVLKQVQTRLLTPVGLRSLAPGHPDYKAAYFGDLHARDAAYHQGTVWAWLIGPFIDAWLKVHPEDQAEALRFLEGFPAHLDEAGIGTISEVFDAEAPFTARGCIAQAWSIAEVLRCWLALTRSDGSNT